MATHTPTHPPTPAIPPTPPAARADHKLSVPDEPAGAWADQLQRAQWLRAAILGANDGLLSTTSLMLGVSAANADRRSTAVSGLAGALSGAFSMAVGEFVSVSTQRDIELAARRPDHTPQSLPTPSPGRSPMMRSMATERSDGHAALPSPVKAAAASGVAFLAGSLVPLLSSSFVARHAVRVAVLVAVTSAALAGFGGAGALLGGSPARASAVRVLVGGWLAMGVTYWMLKHLNSNYNKNNI